MASKEFNPTETEETTCPTCSQPFTSEVGMRIHHGKVHDERLPNRECEDCGREFYDRHATRTYCDGCYSESGSTSSTRTRGNVETTCVECGAEFRYYPSEKAGLYCPSCVADPSVTCNGTASSKGGQRSVDCSHCGVEIRVPRSKATNQQHVFCDRSCYRRWLSTRRREEGVWSGADNPNWRPEANSPETYGSGWSRARRQALERDDYRCQHCGVTRDDLGQNPDVHHQVPVGAFEDTQEAHRLENLVTLCRSCHLRAERAD
jgi:5-methylcytosine-specific restriction endonuclease McrA